MENCNPIQFNMTLAGVGFSVECLFPRTRELCAEFLMEASGELDFAIVTGEADFRREREVLARKGDPQANLSDEAMESLSLGRKIAEILPGRDRVLFHGSCLAYDGQAVLFTAKSGTGKSTHTRLWRENFGSCVAMVNDDKPYLHITPAAVTAWDTPWRGKHGLGGVNAPLKAICLVTRGKENRITRITAGEMLPILLQQTYRPRNPVSLGQTLSLLDLLTRQVALYKLECNMDPQAAVVARNGIFGEEATD